MSLYSDLTEVLTPYANKINELNGSLDNLEERVGEVKFSKSAAHLLVDILRNALYSSDQASQLDELEFTLSPTERIQKAGNYMIIKGLSDHPSFDEENSRLVIR